MGLHGSCPHALQFFQALAITSGNSQVTPTETPSLRSHAIVTDPSAIIQTICLATQLARTNIYFKIHGTHAAQNWKPAVQRKQQPEKGLPGGPRSMLLDVSVAGRFYHRLRESKPFFFRHDDPDDNHRDNG